MGHDRHESSHGSAELQIPIYTIVLAGRRTSVRLRRLERAALDRVCQIEGVTLSKFCERAAAAHGLRNRSASIRLALLTYLMRHSEGFRDLCGPDGDPASTARQDEEQK